MLTAFHPLPKGFTGNHILLVKVGAGFRVKSLYMHTLLDVSRASHWWCMEEVAKTKKILHVQYVLRWRTLLMHFVLLWTVRLSVIFPFSGTIVKMISYHDVNSLLISFLFICFILFVCYSKLDALAT